MRIFIAFYSFGVGTGAAVVVVDGAIPDVNDATMIAPAILIHFYVFFSSSYLSWI